MVIRLHEVDHLYRPGGVMALLSFGSTGCQNTGGASPVNPQNGALLLQVVLTGAGAAVLRNNPKYIPMASALGAGASIAFSSSPTITKEGIDAWVAQVVKSKDGDDNAVMFFQSQAEQIYDAYVTEFKVQVVSATDPNVKLYVNAFANGMTGAAAAATAFPKK